MAEIDGEKVLLHLSACLQFIFEKEKFDKKRKPEQQPEGRVVKQKLSPPIETQRPQWAAIQKNLNWNPMLIFEIFNGVQIQTTLISYEFPTEAYQPFIIEPKLFINGMLKSPFYSIIQEEKLPKHLSFRCDTSHEVFSEAIAYNAGFVTQIRQIYNETWELFLMPDKNSMINGYLFSPNWMKNKIKKKIDKLLFEKKLPLVLDLDDTLVRMIGTEGTMIREEIASRAPHRIKKIGYQKAVVVTSQLDEFLNWASKYFEISICSAGEQNYVNDVVTVIDPENKYIKGIKYSCRDEFIYLNKKWGRNHPPPKDLLNMYSYCSSNNDVGAHFSLPLIVDDSIHVWLPNQRGNVIQVQVDKSSQVWSVNLKPVQMVLEQVHQVFFQRLQQYQSNRIGEIPSCPAIYKEISTGKRGWNNVLNRN